MCGYNALTLVNDRLTDNALVHLLCSIIAFCYFTAEQLLHLLNLHLLLWKKSSQIFCKFDQIPFEIAAFVIKDEIVKIWHSELVTAAELFEVSFSSRPFSNLSMCGAKLRLGERGKEGMRAQFLLVSMAKQVRFVGCLDSYVHGTDYHFKVLY